MKPETLKPDLLSALAAFIRSEIAAQLAAHTARGETLPQLLQRLCLSQSDVAARGFCRATLNRWCHGTGRATPGKMKALAAKLNIEFTAVAEAIAETQRQRTTNSKLKMQNAK